MTIRPMEGDPAFLPGAIPAGAGTVETWLDIPYCNGLSGSLSRGTLSRALHELTSAVGAEHFCLADLSRSHAEQPPHVLSSNWSVDAIDIIGTAAVEMLHQSPFATSLPQEPRLFSSGNAMRSPRVLDEPTALRMIEFGHGEISILKLRAGGRRGVLLFSSGVGGRMDRVRVRRAHLVANYLLSQYRNESLDGGADPLSERERECLLWVSEGKTTEEIALIIGVSGNTVNKYIVSSIQKFSASNRAMAIAIAIRNGVI